MDLRYIMNAPTFSCFSSLPLELRGMIWSATMPVDEPVMYAFGDNFISHNMRVDESYGPPRPRTTRVQVQLPTPEALFVCREARQAAERWMASLNASLHLREETQRHIIVRDWRPETDLLYVSRERWRFFTGCMLANQPSFQDMYASVRHLVLPAFTAYYSISAITEVMEVTSNLASVRVLWGALPEFRMSARHRIAEAPLQPRWVVEVEDSQEVRMCTKGSDGTEVWETGELEEWMLELSQEVAIQEVPAEFVNEAGEVTLPFIPVRMKKE